jgi:hypothetical protein
LALPHDLPKSHLTDLDISAELAFLSMCFHRLAQPFGRQPRHPLQLLLKLGTMLMKRFVNSLSQVHQCFNAHP